MLFTPLACAPMTRRCSFDFKWRLFVFVHMIAQATVASHEFHLVSTIAFMGLFSALIHEANEGSQDEVQAQG